MGAWAASPWNATYLGSSVTAGYLSVCGCSCSVNLHIAAGFRRLLPVVLTWCFLSVLFLVGFCERCSWRFSHDILREQVSSSQKQLGKSCPCLKRALKNLACVCPSCLSKENWAPPSWLYLSPLIEWFFQCSSDTDFYVHGSSESRIKSHSRFLVTRFLQT